MSAAVAALVVVAAWVWPGRSARVGWLGREPDGVSAPTANALTVDDVADATVLLALALQSGRGLVQALEEVAEVRDELAAGGAAGAVWRRHAAHRPELGAVAGAWALSEDLGVALAPSMTTSAQVLRARVQARRRLEASTAGARATMRMLTLLPLVGLLAGFAFGLTPWEVYGHSVVTLTCAVVGLVLTAVGWLVCRWLLARAVAPKVHS